MDYVEDAVGEAGSELSGADRRHGCDPAGNFAYSVVWKVRRTSSQRSR